MLVRLVSCQPSVSHDWWHDADDWNRHCIVLIKHLSWQSRQIHNF